MGTLEARLLYCDCNHHLLKSLIERLGERRGEGNQEQAKAVEISLLSEYFL